MEKQIQILYFVKLSDYIVWNNIYDCGNKNPKKKRNYKSKNQKIYLTSYPGHGQEKPPFSHQVVETSP